MLHLAHQTQIPLQDLNEEIVIDNLLIQGALPLWLEGTLIRNGPAKFHFGTQKISHWFDGLAMLHAFTFGQGKVSYRNKFLRSDAYFQSMEHADLRFMGFAQDPCKSLKVHLYTNNLKNGSLGQFFRLFVYNLRRPPIFNSKFRYTFEFTHVRCNHNHFVS